MPRTCDGAHDFRADCVCEVLGDILPPDEVDSVVDGVRVAVSLSLCPRCMHERLPDSGHRPGSWTTECLCVPIGQMCADHEGACQVLPPDDWPVEVDRLREDVIAAHVANKILWMRRDGRTVPADPDPGSPIYEAVRRLRAVQPSGR